jgi:5-amino-6-(5-phosphoribosylamino)uracil reductase
VQHLSAVGPDVDSEQALVELVTTDRGDPPAGRPWVSSNMVMSLDGAFALHGRSAGLGSEVDRNLFLALRQVADVILVGAGTARAERYRRPSVSPAAAAARAAAGQRPLPHLVLVSRSAAIPADLPLLAGDGPHPVLAHPRSADASGLPVGIEPLACGEDELDLGSLLAELRNRGARWVVCEGGPTLLGRLVAEGLLDEYLLTLSPRLVGGGDVGLLGPVEMPQGAGTEMALHRAHAHGDELLLSYRTRR